VSSQTVNSWRRGCFRQVLLYLGVGGVAILVLGGLFALALSIPGASPDTRALIIGGGLIGIFAIAMVGVIVWGVLSNRRRAAWLDGVFSPAGLAGKPYLMNGRKFHGQAFGRAVEVYFSRGPLFEFYVAANLHTRMAIGTRDALGGSLAQTLKLTPLEIDGLADPNQAASAYDAAWGRSLLSDPQAAPIIQRLIRAEGPYELRHIAVQPDALVLRLIRPALSEITAERMRACLLDLVDLAKIAEALPPPRERLVPSRLEHNSHYR
jgi:hypothetical protein